MPGIHDTMNTAAAPQLTPEKKPRRKPGLGSEISAAEQLSLAQFADTGRFPLQLAQVVELGAAHAANGEHLDLLLSIEPVQKLGCVVHRFLNVWRCSPKFVYDLVSPS